jgi:hydroxymethylpyrimidine/phosphomethylpyrimidine kinase
MSKETLKLALEALESCTPEDTSTSHVIYAWYDEELVNKAIKALEEALAKQEVLITSNSTELEKQEQGEPIKWVGLSVEDIDKAIEKNQRLGGFRKVGFAYDLEQVLKEKNT